MRVRRVAASAAAGLATWLGLGAALPPSPATVPVLVAARDIEAGRVLADGDLRSQSVDPAYAAGGGLTDASVAVGQRLATPLAAGEPVTATRLLPSGALGRLTGDTRAVHVPLSDGGVTGLLRAGDRVDVLRTLDGARVAADLVVIAVDASPEGSRWDVGGSGSTGAGVVLAVPTDSVGAVVQAALGSGRAGGVHVAIRPRR